MRGRRYPTESSSAPGSLKRNASKRDETPMTRAYNERARKSFGTPKDSFAEEHSSLQRPLEEKTEEEQREEGSGAKEGGTDEPAKGARASRLPPRLRKLVEKYGPKLYDMAVKQVIAKIKKKLGMEDDGDDDDDGGADKDPRKGITIHPFFEFPKIELVCTRNPIPG